MRRLTRVPAWLLTLCCLATPVPAQTGGSIIPDVVGIAMERTRKRTSKFTWCGSRNIGSAC